MPHIGVDIGTTPINLDAEYNLSPQQDYSIQCTAVGSYVEEDRQHYEVRILFAAEAPTDMEQAYKDSQVLLPKVELFTYRPRSGESCFVWNPYGGSRISFVEKGD